MTKLLGLIEETEFVCEEETTLTVSKTSLFFAGDGFSVYDCKGDIVFRVDSYGSDIRDKEELVLMDAHGRCLLTVRRKRPSLHQRWEGFVGERTEGQKPIYSVRRSSIIGRSGVTVEVYGGDEYQVEGCFGQRCCTIYNVNAVNKGTGSPLTSPSQTPVAEIRRKVDSTSNVILGKDVFTLVLKPGFDAAFAMGLVLVLDQIDGDDFPFSDSAEVVPTAAEY